VQIRDPRDTIFLAVYTFNLKKAPVIELVVIMNSLKRPTDSITTSR
jgi:hypothetical protein